MNDMPMQNSRHLNWLRLEKISSSESWRVSVRGIFRPRIYLTCRQREAHKAHQVVARSGAKCCNRLTACITACMAV